MYVIRNGIIVQPDRLLFGYELVVEGDRIAAIQRQGTLDAEARGFGIIDAHGGYVTPGLIDIHSDYIETVISPGRPSSWTSPRRSSRPSASFWPTASPPCSTPFPPTRTTSWTSSPCAVGQHREDHRAYRRSKKTEGRNAHLIRHRVHLRLEIDNVHLPWWSRSSGTCAQARSTSLALWTTRPARGQYRDIEIWRKSFRGDITREEAERMLAEQQAAPKLSFEQLDYLAGIAREQGIALASHDDDSLEKLELMRELGCTISEFPISQEVAAAAVERGMATVMGTPNILLGKSHSGNLSARDAVRAGVATCLCSDYYPTAMLQSAFVLHREFKLPLEQAFAMLTINPARAVKIDRELGSLEEGKKADILVVREVAEGQRSYPVITATLVDGRVVSRMWYPALPSMSARFATDAAHACRDACR